jgi:phosphate transport system substrate-binding protein
MQKLYTALAVAAALAATAVADDRLNGGGSSFINPLMTKWTQEYGNTRDVQINYQSVGSGAGIQRMTSKEFDFGCSDAPLTAQQLQQARRQGGEVIHVPVVMGGIVPVYNLGGANVMLNFSGPALADIFMGKITKWNDPKIKALNPQATLPDQNIVVIRRADGSGSTYILSDYLSKVSPEWKSQMGVGTTLEWPKSSVGARGTEGVSGQVKQTTGAIGYVELLYALQNQIPYGALQNAEGAFVQASLESVTAAAAASLKTMPPDFRFSITNAPGKDAYPLSGTTWAVIYASQATAKPDVVRFLRWAISPVGQNMARALQYAPLPPQLVAKIEAKLASLK